MTSLGSSILSPSPFLMLKGVVALTLLADAFGAESSARVVRSRSGSSSRAVDYCSTADAGTLNFVTSVNMVAQDEDSGRLSRWDEKDFRGPLVSVSDGTSPTFGGNGLWFRDSQYLRTCTSSLGIEACDDTNQYQKFASVDGGAFQLTMGIQTYADITAPQLVFSAENFGASNFQVWLLPVENQQKAAQATRLVRFGVAYPENGKLNTSLTVETCVSKKAFNTFTVQVFTGENPTVKYYKDGYLLSSSVDAREQLAAKTEFALPVGTSPYKAVKANCGETFKFGCGSLSASLNPGYAQCFTGKLGMINVRRSTLSTDGVRNSVHQMMSDYLGLSGGEICGDGVLGSRETCDDKNIFSNDGCGCDCQGECPIYDPPGDDSGYIITGEETGQFVGATRTVKCAEGFDAFTNNAVPEDTVECTPELKWSASALTCRRRCSEFSLTAEQKTLMEVAEDPTNPGIKSGAARIVSCKSDPNVLRQDWGNRKSQIIRCTDGKWNDVNLLCEQSCGTHPSLPAGLQIVEYNSTTKADGSVVDDAKTGVSHGARFKVTCDNKTYFPSASTALVNDKNTQEVVCRKGKWSDISLECFRGCQPFEMPGVTGYEGTLVLATGADYKGGVNVTTSFIAMAQSEDAKPQVLGADLDTLVPHGSYVEVSCVEPAFSRPAGLPSYEKAYCSDGQWTKTSVLCQAQCPTFQLPADFDPLSVLITDVAAGNAHGALKRLECAEGYSSSVSTLDDNGKMINKVTEDLRCMNGKWEQPIMRCRKTCPSFPSMGLAFMVEEYDGGVQHGAVRELSCAQGYHGIDLTDSNGAAGKTTKGLESQKIMCIDGKWSQRLIQCVRDCDGFPNDEQLNKLRPNAKIRQITDSKQTEAERTSTAHGASRLVQCDDINFPDVTSISSAYASQERVWCVNGTWALPAMRCRTACDDAPIVKNARVVGAGRQHGDTRSVTCQAGFASLSGLEEETLTCRNGEWTKSIIQCEPGCGTYPALGAAYSVTGADTGVGVGASRVITCGNGFSTTGVTTSTTDKSVCQEREDGTTFWSPVTLQCGMPCDEFVPEEGYEVSYDGLLSHALSEGAKRVLRCATGYSVYGGQQPATVQCVGGKWTAKDLVCYAKCSEFPSLDHRFSVKGEGISTGSTREVTCASGFRDTLGRSAETLVCLNGVWSKRTLDCQGTCPANVAGSLGLKEGQFVVSEADDGSALTHGARRRVTCGDGYATPAGAATYQETVCTGGNWAPVSIQCTPRCNPAADKDPIAYESYYLEQTTSGSPRKLDALEIPGNQEGLVRAISCAAGYAPIRGASPSYSVCAGGVWSETPIVCAKACANPRIPTYMAQIYPNGTIVDIPEAPLAASAETTTVAETEEAHPLSAPSEEVAGLSTEDVLQAKAAAGDASAFVQLRSMRTTRRRRQVDLSKSLFSHGTRVNVGCNEKNGWFADSAVREDEVVCASGEWTPLTVTCQRPCAPFALSSFETTQDSVDAYKVEKTNTVNYFNDENVTYSQHLPGTEFQVSCAEGYTSAQGQGSSEKVRCVDTNCDMWENPEECNSQWTPVALQCHKNCPRRTFSSNFVAVGQEQTTHGSTIRVSCASGFASSDEKMLTQDLMCNDGEWTPLVIECELPCPNPVRTLANDLDLNGLAVVNANTLSAKTSFPHGYEVDISCKESFGSIVSDDAEEQTETLVCHKGAWTKRTISCLKGCGDVAEIDLSKYQVHGAGSTFGSVREVSCRSTEGYYPLVQHDAEEAKQALAGFDFASILGNNTNGMDVNSMLPADVKAQLNDLNVDRRTLSTSAALRANVVCQASGKWTKNTLACDLTCSDWESYKSTYLSEGYIIAADPFNSKENRAPADAFKVSCDEAAGFYPVDPNEDAQTITCSGGRWSERIMECRRACSSASLDPILHADNANYNIYSYINVVDKADGSYEVIEEISEEEASVEETVEEEAAAAAFVQVNAARVRRLQEADVATEPEMMASTLVVEDIPEPDVAQPEITMALVDKEPILEPVAVAAVPEPDVAQPEITMALVDKEPILEPVVEDGFPVVTKYEPAVVSAAPVEEEVTFPAEVAPVAAVEDVATPAVVVVETTSTTTTSRVVVGRDLFSDIVNKPALLSHGAHLDVSCAAGYSPSNILQADVVNKLVCRDGKWTPLTLRCEQDCKPYVPLTLGEANKAATSAASFLQMKAAVRTQALNSTAAASEPLISDEVLKTLLSQMEGQKEQVRDNMPVVKVLASSSAHATRHGSWVDVSCDATAGFASQTNLPKQRLICEDGVWSANKLACMPTCGDYSLPSDAKEQQLMDNRYTITAKSKSSAGVHFPGAITEVSCKEGYIPYGSLQTSEQSVCFNGRWTPVHLRCKRPLQFEWTMTQEAKFGAHPANNLDHTVFGWKASPMGDLKPMGDSILRSAKYPKVLSALISGLDKGTVKTPAGVVQHGNVIRGNNYYNLAESSFNARNFKCLGQVTSQTGADGKAAAPNAQDYLCVVESCIEEIAPTKCTTCDKTTEPHYSERSIRWQNTTPAASEKPVTFWGSAMWWLMTGTQSNSKNVPEETMYRLKWSCVETCPSSQGWKFTAAEIDHIHTWSSGACQCSATGCTDVRERAALAKQKKE